MKILLYGGSFDPPHNGHLNNLRAAAACVCPDRVVVMPAGLSPFKQHTPLFRLFQQIHTAQKGRFSRAGRPYKCDFLSFMHFKADIVQHLSISVSKRYMTHVKNISAGEGRYALR